MLVQRLTRTAAETRSFARAALVMAEAVGVPVSAQTIERVVHDVGRELAQRRDADPRSDAALAPRSESPPQLAVVECDGGRIRTREPGHGPGVPRTAEGGREDKNACLIRAWRTVAVEDPQGVRTKIAKMSKVGRHSLDCDPDEFSEKSGVF